MGSHKPKYIYTVYIMMTTPRFHLPSLVAHADWSKDKRKRWVACAWLHQDGTYHASSPEEVGDINDLFEGLRKNAGEKGCVLVGFDFPIGLPVAYARKVGIEDFLAVLPWLGKGEWVDFYNVAEKPDQINLHRPFYPNRPGGTRRLHLISRLGLSDPDELRRECEKGKDHIRRSACPLFWPLGAQQVGKAAITGWRDLLAPALLNPRLDLAIWPFSGALNELLKPGWIIVAETYPAEFYTHLGLPVPPGKLKKRVQSSRQEQAETLLTLARELNIQLHPELVEAITGGFGNEKASEDRFDAAVGLLGMLNVLLGGRDLNEPADSDIRRIEGWIFGQ
jgi:hypothetical protein